MKRASVWVVAAAVLAGGCGGPKLHPVRGVVKFDGKPMKGGGSIAFMPVGNQPGRAPGGEIKDDGTFELSTAKPGDGAMTGEFRVVIHQSTDREPVATKDGERAGKAVTVVGEADRIPPVYSDPSASPLRATIEPKDNNLTLELRRDAGPPAVKGATRGRDPFAPEVAGRVRLPSGSN